jgi:hypothetical protein
MDFSEFCLLIGVLTGIFPSFWPINLGGGYLKMEEPGHAALMRFIVD